MGRGFKKISYEKFSEEISNERETYEKFKVPKRATINSAGYDFFLLENLTFKKGEIKKIPTGIKSYMQADEMLFLIVRSGVGFKYNMRLCNQIGVIDSDYYDNEKNEGHIWFSIQNEGDKEVSFKKGDSLIQGIFLKFLKTDDDFSTETRKGGTGSTNGGEKNE